MLSDALGAPLLFLEEVSLGRDTDLCARFSRSLDRLAAQTKGQHGLAVSAGDILK